MQDSSKGESKRGFLCFRFCHDISLLTDSQIDWNQRSIWVTFFSPMYQGISKKKQSKHQGTDFLLRFSLVIGILRLVLQLDTCKDASQISV